MRSILLLSIVLSLVSFRVYADAIETIKIFHNDEVKVTGSSLFVSNTVAIEIFNLDGLENTNRALNELVKSRVGAVTAQTAKEKYQSAFSDVLNGPEWPGIYQQFSEGGRSIEFALRYQIKKLPAIVFNERDIVYGVTSLDQAVQIYRQHGGQ